MFLNALSGGSEQARAQAQLESMGFSSEDNWSKIKNVISATAAAARAPEAKAHDPIREKKDVAIDLGLADSIINL
jgi:hypothetical protein